MTDSTNNQPASKSPTHIAYHVRNRKGGEGFWTRIGTAWPHADGNGLNIRLETYPLDGRITLRVASDKPE
jgi:hypothetical protein